VGAEEHVAELETAFPMTCAVASPCATAMGAAVGGAAVVGAAVVGAARLSRFFERFKNTSLVFDKPTSQGSRPGSRAPPAAASAPPSLPPPGPSPCPGTPVAVLRMRSSRISHHPRSVCRSSGTLGRSPDSAYVQRSESSWEALTKGVQDLGQGELKSRGSCFRKLLWRVRRLMPCIGRSPVAKKWRIRPSEKTSAEVLGRSREFSRPAR